MDYKEVNKFLNAGEMDTPGLFPHIEALKEEPFEFFIDFGLEDLPRIPGLILSNEIDFVMSKDSFLEVKIGKANPLEFAWFKKSFPKGRLTVVNENRFSLESVKGITLEDFLLEC